MLHPFPLSAATLDAIKAERDKLDIWRKVTLAAVDMPGAMVGYDDLLEHYRLLVEERDKRVGDEALLRYILKNLDVDANQLTREQLVHNLTMIGRLIQAQLIERPDNLDPGEIFRAVRRGEAPDAPS